MRLLAIALLSMTCARDEVRPPVRAPNETAPSQAVAAPSPAVAAPSPAPAAEPPPVVVAAAAPDPREATRHAAHEALVKHCGTCHESHRPTAKPKALAIFDLDKPDWPTRFDEHRFKSALARLSKQSDAARDAFIAFRDAELAAQTN